MRPLALLEFLGRAVRNGWFWAGVPLMALSFYALLVLLSWEPISLVIPASALSYVVGTLGAKYHSGRTDQRRAVGRSCAGLRRSSAGCRGLTANYGILPLMMNEPA